jgi:hypothetical protein
MATIEPRLIHLLNDSTPKPAHIDLPPPHILPLHVSSDKARPVSSRDDIVGPDSPASILPSALLSFPTEDSPRNRGREDGRQNGGYVSSTGLQPLRLRQAETDVMTESGQLLLSKILDDTPDFSDDGSNKKRHRVPHGKEDFLQLPQPLKKQKPAPPATDLPPIINGLHNVPPHETLFPPIDSTSFEENDATQLRLIQEFSLPFEEKQTHPSPQGSEKDNSQQKQSRKRAAKPRRKWSEEETNHLLLGVSRHGVGKWTTILEDLDFNFNERTAGDLKDRFRTCCPAELRSSKEATPTPSGLPQQKAKKGIHSENILHDVESPSCGLITPPTEFSDNAPKQKKSRAHRKKMEDLESLGIHAPFKKSHRRERRPFTLEDDREILEGLESYGPAWTKIQRDPRFNLSTRQPTDLRDRIRNKYPEVFQKIEKGAYSKDANRGSDLMEPTVTTSINNTLGPSKTAALEPQVNHKGSGDDFPRWALHSSDMRHANSSPTIIPMGDASVSHVVGGEMDISRLLLDDTNSV